MLKGLRTILCGCFMVQGLGSWEYSLSLLTSSWCSPHTRVKVLGKLCHYSLIHGAPHTQVRVAGQLLRYEVLAHLEFTSERR